jgi:hypothetical protein
MPDEDADTIAMAKPELAGEEAEPGLEAEEVTIQLGRGRSAAVEFGA